MPSIGWEERPRFKQCFSPLASKEDGCSSSYYKLPEQLIKLSVLKLDGSSFDIQISRCATVGEVKLAVEELFSRSTKEEGEGEISWIHVWGHFCLCYDGQKLLNDKESLITFGIKDGDQILFKRHMSMNYNPARRPTRNHKRSHKQHKMSSSGQDIDRGKLDSNEDDIEDDNEEDKSHHSNNENAIIKNAEFKLAHFLKGWFSFSRLWCRRRMRLEGRTHLAVKLGWI
ncbi:hypothetical protein AAC387_Pa04g1359 [Persea americana]